MLRIFIPIYLLLLLYSLFAENVSDFIVMQFTEDALEQDNIDDFSGAFALLEEILLRTPVSEWPPILEKVSSKNIPVSTAPLARFQDDENAQSRIKQGEPWYDPDQDIIYKRAGESEYVIYFGPVAKNDELALSEFVASLSGALLLIATIVVWTFTVRRRIKVLEKSTTSFGEGDLDARVSEKDSVRISKLNRNFNLMADRIQELIESNKLLSNAMAHELRSPLTRIQFEVELMKDTPLAHSQLAAVESIEDDLLVLEGLVDEMLTYAKYERQSLSVNRQSVNLVEWLDNWYQNYRFNTSLLYSYQTDGSQAKALIDDVGFDRALQNLVSNAEKYGSKEIVINVTSDKHNLYIAIEDDGEGIPISEREKLFEPFARADNSRTRTTGGYGMGLAIVAKIIERHKGTIAISDSALGGAKFLITLPTTA